MITLYERFANKENLNSKLVEFGLENEEREDLLSKISKIYEQHLLISILDCLEDYDRNFFLEKFYYGNEIEVVGFLQERVDNLDNYLREKVSTLELEIFEMLERNKNV